jgi:iron(III) transport system ATP-binding protein
VNKQQAFLSLDGLAIEFDGKSIVSDIGFTLEKGEIGCLLGPSGCGKTSLLRSIAGLDPIAQGEITLSARLLSKYHSQPMKKIMIATEQRNIGMVFQDYALFPHLSVLANVSFGLHSWDKKKAQQRALMLLEQVGLHHREEAMPHELSGGEQQRVALARALAPQPSLLLLDEPFSNLDVELRESLGQDVKSILKSTDTTALLVTHDQHEAFAIADKIGVIQGGGLQQWGSAYDIYHRPISRFVADFVGQGAFIDGVILNGNSSSERVVATTLGEFELSPSLTGETLSQGDQVRVLLRPDDIIHDDDSRLQAMVKSRLFRGAEFLYTLALANGEQLLALVPSHHNHAENEAIGIRLEIDHVVVFKA